MTITVKKSNEAVIVPVSVRRQAGIKAGDRLEFKVSGRVITIRPTKAQSSRAATRLSGIHREIAKGLEDVRSGRTYGPFDSVEEMAASIESEIGRLRRSARPKAR
jgi:bifunctional DNA-binding transcriptional regulator/antitoxin component of YhaV-PrlF toxin-antitoxin module